MIIPDKKKAVTVIVAKKMAGGGMAESEMKPEHAIGEHGQVLEGIAEDLIHAIKIGSAHAVSLALKAAFNACEMEPSHDGASVEDENEF